jgi:hypothetical protein
MKSDEIWKILEAVQAQIRAFDTKSQIVIGVDGVTAGFVISSAQKLLEAASGLPLRPSAVTALFFEASAIACFLISLIFAVWTVTARLKYCQPLALTFFSHIVKTFGNDYEKCQRTYSSLTEQEFMKQVSSQILTNSKICQEKGTWLRRAHYSMLAGLIFWFAALPFAYSTLRNPGVEPVMTEKPPIHWRFPN